MLRMEPIVDRKNGQTHGKWIKMQGYVNHTINNGDFTGLLELPFWTQDSIGERIRYQRGVPVWALFKNYYNIINKLLWVGQGFNYEQFAPTPPDKNMVSLVKRVNGKSWDECLEKWSEAEWEAKIPFPASCHAAIKYVSGYSVIRIKSSFRLNSDIHKNTSRKLFRAYDLYLKLQTFSEFHNDGTIFCDPDYGCNENKLIRIVEEPFPNVYPFIDVKIGHYDNISLSKPQKVNRWYGWFCKLPENIFIVSKYDVPNGFEFVPPKK